MLKRTGNGKAEYADVPRSTDVVVQLWNFDIDGSSLKKEHIDMLRGVVVPRAKSPPCGISLIGLASTTGDESKNYALGRQRAEEVLKFLVNEAGRGFVLGMSETRGEDMARHMGWPDNTENERFRAVWLRISKNAKPPPGPDGVSPPPVRVEGWTPDGSSAGQFLDVVGGSLGILELGLDIAALTAGATFAALSGLAVGCIAAIVGMPLVWADTAKTAEFNGQVEGFASALQDMSNQYKNAALDRKAVKDWLRIQQPQPHMTNNPPQHIGVEYWRKGQRMGCNTAFAEMIKLENKPVQVATTKQGKLIKINVNGRLLLRLLYLAKKDRVGSMVFEAVNKKLKEKGKKPWPTS